MSLWQRKANGAQAVLSSKKAPKHDKKEAQHHDIDVMLGFDLVPFLSQEEITDIPVLDPVSAHIELIEGNNVLGEVVADTVIRAKLAADGDNGLCHGYYNSLPGVTYILCHLNGSVKRRKKRGNHAGFTRKNRKICVSVEL